MNIFFSRFQIVDPALDPIIWQVTKAEIVDWPVDQFGQVVSVVDVGPQNREFSSYRFIFENV